MIILGIGDSHEAHACILQDGHLIAAIAEERLSRLKADMGYPRRAIEAVLAQTGIDPARIDKVAYAGAKGNPFIRLYKRSALFSVNDWLRQNHDYFKPMLLGGQKLTAADDFDKNRHLRPDLADDPYYPFVDLARGRPLAEWEGLFRRVRVEAVERHLGIPADKVVFYRHEECHQAYAQYSSPVAHERALIATVEGGGDDSSATLSLLEHGRRTEVWRSNACSLGRLYRNMTLLLGMRPGQDEYKVMGLAPYGNDHVGRGSLEVFRRVDRVDGIKVERGSDFPDLYFALRDALEGQRFDGIAWGLQTYLEETLCAWIGNAVAHFGIGDVLLSGGVAQNIKACRAVADVDAVRSVWSGPVAGDGSLAIGAVWLAQEAHGDQPPKGLPSVYLGTTHGEAEVETAIRDANLGEGFDVVEHPGADLAAQWLARGNIVARFSGAMEFGQRALGNRSILADPRHPAMLGTINSKVKFRDFWMPFTPSMLMERCADYLVNPADTFSPFMTMAFATTPRARADLPAALHPADWTARPQMLRQQDNPGYHALIAAFQRQTTVGAILNTSFNLHGEAIVESPADAVSAFLRSDMDVLLFDQVAVKRHRDE